MTGPAYEELMKHVSAVLSLSLKVVKPKKCLAGGTWEQASSSAISSPMGSLAVAVLLTRSAFSPQQIRL